MARLRFTKRAIEAIRPDPSRRLHFRDEATPGLELIVQPSGVRVFYLSRRMGEGASSGRVRLGRFPTLTLDDARRAAAKLNGAIAEGKDPRDPLRAARAELTVAKAFAEFDRRHAAPRKRSAALDRWMFGKYCGPIQAKRLSAIKPRDVAALHAKVGEEAGHAQANRLLTLLRALFNKCQTWGLLDGPNPVRGVERFRELPRERFLRAEELPRFFGALSDEPDRDVRDFVLLALLTGARKSNVLGMRWADLRLDVDDPTWTIPAADAKAGEPITVPLVPEAKDLLLERRPEEGTPSPWVFPGPREGQHLADVRAGWARILQRAEIADLRLHDLRRTLGSWQLRTGASLAVIGKGLGHRSVSTTALYARLDIDPVREAMQRAASALYAAGKAKQEGTVHEISEAKRHRRAAR